MNASKLLLVGVGFSASACLSWGALNISNGSALTENFNTLANSGATGSVLPPGWAIAESGTAANATYGVNNGGGSTGGTGNTYSYGATGDIDRALGSLQSNALVPSFGLEIENTSGSTITDLLISYVGEQWRMGAAGRVDQLDFEYSEDATSLTSGAWTAFNTLDFVAPSTALPLGARDGNAAANQTAKTGTISGLQFLNGNTMWLRWLDLNATGADDGLAVDGFSIQATLAPTTVPEPSTYFAGLLLALPFGVHGFRYLRNRKRA